MQRKVELIIVGNVQGVGFRFTVERIARKFQVMGFVKNLPNGKVELVAEGEETGVGKFLADIEAAFDSCILDVEKKWSDPDEEFEGFGIRF